MDHSQPSLDGTSDQRESTVPGERAVVHPAGGRASDRSSPVQRLKGGRARADRLSPKRRVAIARRAARARWAAARERSS